MNLERQIFCRSYYYNKEQVEHYVEMIQQLESVKRRNAYKNLVFRMMKDIIIKNIANYINLLTGINAEIPTREDMISDCYVMFDKCLEKYKVNQGYNFYFYFNKSLSRNLYMSYKEISQGKNKVVEYTDINVYYADERVENKGNSVELLVHILGFNEIERRICISKANGVRCKDFLKQNSDITTTLYNQTLRKIRKRLLELKQNGEI
jgi:hypothetical protein